MDSRYTARLVVDRKTIRRFYSNNLNRVTALIITDLERRHPNAIGFVRDNHRHRVVSRIRYNKIMD